MKDGAAYGCRRARLDRAVAVRALGAAALGAAAAMVWVVPTDVVARWTEDDALWRSTLSVLGVAASAAAAWSAGRHAARPWADLQAALHRCDGEDDAALPTGGGSEVRHTVEVLNGWIERRRQARDRQRRLLGDASHQLRTPLAVLRTVLQGTAPADLGAHRDEMLRTVDRATAVVNEMLARMKLDQRRAEGAGGTLQRLDEVSREAAIEFAPLIGARRLRFELDAVPLEIQADAWMLGELVRNLLANAIRHSPDDGLLGIVVRAAHDGPELIVWDSGAGVGDGPRERLFEPFAAASGGGIGLGLSICRELAQAMGARVELYNRTDGHKATGVDAVVRWPTASTPLPPSPTTRSGEPR
jgi:two-component system sensor histidine kinase TctE